MKTEEITFNSAGYELAGGIDLPEDIEGKTPAVVLFHGLSNSRKDCPLIEETSKALAEEGFIAFRFDQHGSGESPGQMQDKQMDILEQNAKDSVEFIASDDRVDENRLGLWGRSLGGTLTCLLPPSERIKARVAASPSVEFERLFKEKFEELKEKERELEEKGKKLPGTGDYKGPFRFKEAWFESLEGLDDRIKGNLPKLDTVLTFGTSQDQKVQPWNSCIVMNKAGNPKRIWIFQADHDFAGAEEEAVNEVIDWFKKYVRQ